MNRSDYRQFMIVISPTYSLSVINGFWSDQPEVGLFVNGRVVDVCPIDTLSDLFTIVYHVKALNFSDFPVYHGELVEIERLTKQVYEMGGGAD